MLNQRTKRRIWENAIIETLEHRPNKKADYILLRSEQVSYFNRGRLLSHLNTFKACRDCTLRLREIDSARCYKKR